MKILKRKTLAALLALSLLASILPLGAQPVLAAAPSGQVIYIGNHAVTSGGYWMTDDSGKVTVYSGEGAPTDNYIYYNAANNTLTLHNATIKESVSSDTSTYVAGAAIGVVNQNGAAELTINLVGTNTIANVSAAIHVFASSDSTGAASLTITGSGSLKASGSVNPGILVQSNSGDATLRIKDAEVEATVTSSSGYGVMVRAGSSSSSSASLSVDGGSLTATGSGNDGAGIRYTFGGGTSGSGRPSLTVSENAIVKAINNNGGGIVTNSSTTPQVGADSTESNGGIVFNGKNGTVYGSVTLQEDLTIGEDESLSLSDGASLNADGHNVIVDGGTLGEDIKNSLGDSVKYPPTITTTTLPNGTVGETYNQTLAADGTAPIAWSVTTGSLPAGLILKNDGTITGIPTAQGESTFTVTATNDYGSDSKQFTLTIEAATDVSVESVSLNMTTLELTEGSTETLTATITPNNATNQNVAWSSSDSSIVTVEADQIDNTKATVKALKEGSATITATTADGNKTATCTVTVKEPPYTGKYSYEVSTSVGDHGSLTVDRYATEGEKVTITVTPDEAYLLDDLVVTAGGKDVELVDNGDGTYTFTMPSADVKITATFAKDPDWTEPEEPATDVSDIFLDVAPNAWYKDAVQYAYDSGLMTGVSANEFAPEATTTRAMIVSMLARLEGVESAESAGFTDVAANDWYATAVNWAAASGITSGTGDGNFSPNTAITREQLAAILMNYAQYKGQDVSARATLDTYSDAAAISSWANDVMSWAVAEGLLTGVTADTLQPQGAATRAQVAAILQRFLSE